MADERDEANAAGTGHGAPALRALLTERYGDLKSRLARRLGSTEWAEDALQDTYLRLDGAEAVGKVRNPVAYLFRAAFNIALNQRRAEVRRLGAAEVDDLLHIADDAPDAQRIIEGRSDIERLKHIMAELPPRPRAILLAARLEGLSRQAIAQRFRISVSLVEKELRRAQEYCVTRFRQGRGRR
ncbi:RNA polymerase sigma factor [Bradyrhizobium sp. 2TAF24]|uniref:RNA polymerase sigma factor n=1 Tax=Bradyrhizobium sp. 2TAF24 TaxID=3233011 RepID=UPI003F921662